MPVWLGNLPAPSEPAAAAQLTSRQLVSHSGRAKGGKEGRKDAFDRGKREGKAEEEKL